MKILYIPLDERPCNFLYPQMIMEGKSGIDLVKPALSLLGNKKVPANVDNLWQFVEENIHDCDIAILSIDMLLYGGLIPSRIHDCNELKTNVYLSKLKALKKLNPQIKIYGFQCIMRSPHYNSSEEEPTYYAEFGEALHTRATFIDKQNRIGLTALETIEYQAIQIPKEIIMDYENRRDFNLKNNLEVVKFVEEGFIDFMVIPQDDSSEFGYTAMEQKQVLSFIRENRLEMKIHVYPGADEVGCTLLARSVCEHKNTVVKVYSFYASVNGPYIIPLYEDRPLHESLKYHLDACHALLVDTVEEADFVLAINCPGSKMQEAFDQEKLDLTYTSHRNLRYFAKQIKRYIDEKRNVVIVDSAFSNGGDLQLLTYLDELDVMDKLHGYSGWNTNCNSLGTVLASGILGYKYKVENSIKHTVYRYIEDILYQSNIRQKTIKQFLPQYNLGYYDFKDKQELVEKYIQNELQKEYNKLKIAKKHPYKILAVYMPWQRMFEIGMKLSI